MTRRPKVWIVQQATGGGVDGKSSSWYLTDAFNVPLEQGLFQTLDRAREWATERLRYAESEIGVRPLYAQRDQRGNVERKSA